MIYLLTQDGCPKCDAIKQFITKALGNSYLEKIKIVHRTENEELFRQLVKDNNIMSTPVLIADNDILLNPTISNVKEFIDKNL